MNDAWRLAYTIAAATYVGLIAALWPIGSAEGRGCLLAIATLLVLAAIVQWEKPKD